MNTNSSLYDAIDEVKKRFFTYRQRPEDDNEIHLRAFKSNSDVIEHYKRNLYDDNTLLDYERKLEKKIGKSSSDRELKAIVKEK